MDDEKRQALEKLYSELSPAERRRRVILEPAFRDDYNELVQAHRIVPVPNYFWEHWLPVLGPVACALYIQLRRYCYHNAQTGEKRETCWPKQATLAREVGVRDPKTVRKGLALLESFGFIERERTYYRDAASGRPHQGSDKYRVFFEIPLTAADAAEFLIRRTAPNKTDFVPASYGGTISPHSPVPVDNSPYDGRKSLHAAREKIPSRTSTRTIQTNVDNVIDDNRLENEAKDPPPLNPPPRRSPNELSRIERLAFEIGESLKAMGGERGGGDHHSRRFHLLLASRLPERLLRTAVTATRDAVEAQRSGRGGLRSDAGAYFAGIVRRLAEADGLEFPGRSRPKPVAAPAVHPSQRMRQPSAGPQAEDDRPLPPEEAKKFLAELIANLSAKTSG